MATNWMRRYILTAGPEGGSGFKIGHINSATETALHVSFSIEKSTSETGNEAKVQIWNLSDVNLKILEQEGCTVELRAGYGDTLALIFRGEVSDVTTTKDNADRMTEFTVIDGLTSTSETYVSISLTDEVNTKSLYEQIAAEMGLSVVFAPGLKYTSLPYGFSYVGSGSNALSKVADYNGHKWTIQNEVIQIYKTGQYVNGTGYVISKETGMINIPKRIKIGGSTEEASSTGYEVEFLLNGSIGVNDLVSVQSNVISGTYTVYKLSISGDNMSSDWKCTAQLIEA